MIDLTISKGEFLLICGPNGSGKTTLICLISGLFKPTAGSIRVNDLNEVASRLFSGLRFLDEAGVDVGIAEGVFPEKREGRAIMNRLRKAAKEWVSCYKEAGIK